MEIKDLYGPHSKLQNGKLTNRLNGLYAYYLGRSIAVLYDKKGLNLNSA